MQDVRLHSLHLGILVLLLFDTKIMLDQYQYRILFHLQNIDQYNIGEYFEFGKGRDIDLIQALFWYRKAAAQGDQRAADAVERIS